MLELKAKLLMRQKIFQFTLPDETVVEVDGKLLVGRPEDRIKKKILK